MKKNYLLFVCCLLIHYLGAQTIEKSSNANNVLLANYIPFPDSNAVWNFRQQLHCLQGGGNYWTNYTYTYNGDTLINGNYYHQLVVPYYYAYITGGTCLGGPAVSQPGQYIGAIRQDTLQRKVYFVEKLAQTETLLYDFNLQVGDTVKGYLASTNIPDQVIAIDSIQINSLWHRRWLINMMYNIYIIEGIGSTYGLVRPSAGSLSDSFYYYLDCFKLNGTTLYPTVGIPCNIILNDYESPLKDAVFIYPTPMQTSACIHVPNKMLGAKYVIYNAQGKVVQSDIIQNIPYILNRKGLSSGIYFLQIANDHSFLSQELILE